MSRQLSLKCSCSLSQVPFQLVGSRENVFREVKIFSLTAGVPPDRQKVMVAGATVLDEDWGKAKAKIKEVE